MVTWCVPFLFEICMIIFRGDDTYDIYYVAFLSNATGTPYSLNICV